MFESGWKNGFPGINLTLKSNSYEAREAAIRHAVKTGALAEYEVELERGEQRVRRLWLRPDVRARLSHANLGDDQFERVHAALKRYVVGGLFNVVSKSCSHAEVSELGDIRELKTKSPPFVEMRFKPPRRDLRLFGRFICEDGLILISTGMKSLEEKKVGKPIRVPDELKRCEDFFESRKFDPSWIPSSIEGSITNAKII